MSKFIIKINYDKIIEANSNEEAHEKFWKELNDNLAIKNESLANIIINNTSIKECCPHCEKELKPKIIKDDLIEHYVCEKCGYEVDN